MVDGEGVVPRPAHGTLSVDRNRYEKLFQLFAEARSLSPEARASFLNAQCGNDEALRDELSKLLRFEEADASSVDPLAERAILEARKQLIRGVGGEERAEHGTSPRLPTSIGRYRIIRRIASGGMGTVYEAQQDSPRRRVALKMVHGQRATQSVIERLQRESEILGRLQHPGIAQVYDAGMVDVGDGAQPFFAMEFIDGVSLTKFADVNKLDDRARLELLATVCDAVHYAHGKGVVHRDLKPDNILVDADGRPKVLDFGVARITSDSTHDVSTMTREGQILGTLSYMAPEQMNHGPDSVTAAADMYALGVIGFELLSEQLPHDVTGRSVAAALRVLLESEPKKIGDVDAHLRGDVQTIIGKALEREPQRRYKSAAAMAADIRRFLHHEPIEARPPSAIYRTRKFVRRNRTLVGGTLATMLVLIAGIVVASILAAAERNQRHLATERETQARHNNIKAMRGLYAGSQMFEQRDEVWEAVRQLNVIERGARGWEWKHLSLRLPWLIDDAPFVRMPEDDTLISATFVNDHELFQFANTGYIGVHDLWSGQPREINLPGIAVQRTERWFHAPSNRVAVITMDGQLGAVDVAKETFESFNYAWHKNVSDAGRVRFSENHGLAATWNYNDPRFSVFDAQGELFHMDSGLGPGMQWVNAHFLRHHPYLIVERWGGKIYVVDTSKWTIITESNFVITGLGLSGVSADESTLYASTPKGIERWSIPSLEPLPIFVEGLGHLEQLDISRDGRRVSVTSVAQEKILVFDTNSGEQIFEAAIGQRKFNRPQSFSPNGRLIRGESPDKATPWIIDVDEPDEPAFTTLTGHTSWIYQLAVSHDSSLLASAAPDGDILLWDLENSRTLVRIARFHDKSESHLAHNMNAPLVFTPDGDALLFAEFDAEAKKTGLTRINLQTGERTWTAHDNPDAVLDAVAALLPEGQASSMYHHAALLADGRMVQSTAYRGGRSPAIRIRRAGEAGVQIPNQVEGRIDAGVAADPKGRTYATGEYRVVRIRDAKTDAVLHELVDGVSNFMWGVTYSPDGERFAIGTEDGRVAVYETEFFEKLCDIHMPAIEGVGRNYVYNMMWTPDGTRLVTCGAGTVIRIVESQRPFQRDHRRKVWNEALDRARRALAVGDETHDDATELDESAMRVAHIEQWAERDATNETPAAE